MATSSLDPDLNPRRDRSLGTGHGTGALGPSDTSDSGSDVTGGVGFHGDEELELGFDQGTTSDLDRSAAGGTAGPDVGDANLDSDTDAVGTGEHKAAGRDAVISDGQDIDVDQIQALDDVPDLGEDLSDIPDIRADEDDSEEGGDTRH